MPERLSKSQIDKLGERLRDPAQISEADLTLLQQVRAQHDAAMGVVADRLASALGSEPGGRLKTVGTIVDKLRREHLRLSQMQDIAGVRVVKPMSLTEQDALVATVSGLFAGAKVVDRREKPSHGYRAVHVIVAIDSSNVEIQVRTEVQHLWAQLFERFADLYGRGIRYGLPPDRPDEVFFEDVTVGDAVAALIDVSAMLGDLEQDLGTVRPELHLELHEELVTALRSAVLGVSMRQSSS